MVRPNTHTPSFFFDNKLPDSPENLHNTTKEERTSKMASNWKMDEHGDLFFYMETFSAIRTIVRGVSTAYTWFPSQRATNAEHWYIYFVVSPNKLSDKHSIWNQYGAHVMMSLWC